MPQNLRFVFFDVGNTLLFANRPRILAPLYERNVVPSEDLLRRLEAKVKNKFDDIVEQDGKRDQSFWDMFYTRLFESLKLSDEELRQLLIANTRTSANWDYVRPGTAEALTRIQSKYKTGVISNADGKIARVLARCGIADGFLSITDSGLVGHEKPDPVIFETALKSLSARAEESLYVGDVYSVDYRGATGAGMQAVLFDVSRAYHDRGLPRVESLEELEEKIG